MAYLFQVLGSDSTYCCWRVAYRFAAKNPKFLVLHLEMLLSDSHVANTTLRPCFTFRSALMRCAVRCKVDLRVSTKCSPSSMAEICSTYHDTAAGWYSAVQLDGCVPQLVAPCPRPPSAETCFHSTASRPDGGQAGGLRGGKLGLEGFHHHRRTGSLKP